jgi:periplasmic divalent cation tolerance protein
MTDKIVVLSTCASLEDGERLARALVDARLAACVNLIPAMRSVYRWRGAVESESECLIVIKSSREQFDALRETVAMLHPYDVPELIALPILDGAPNYLDWLTANVRGGRGE